MAMVRCSAFASTGFGKSTVWPQLGVGNAIAKYVNGTDYGTGEKSL